MEIMKNNSEDLKVLIKRIVELLNSSKSPSKTAVFNLVKSYGVDKDKAVYLYEADNFTDRDLAVQYLNNFLSLTRSDMATIFTSKNRREVSILTTLFFGYGILCLQIPILELAYLSEYTRAGIEVHIKKYRIDSIFYNQLAKAYKLNLISK